MPPVLILPLTGGSEAMQFQSSPLPEDYITRNQAAKLAGGCHPSTVYRWVRAGRLRGWRVEGKLFVSRAEVLAIIRPVNVPLTPEAQARLRSIETERILREKGVKS
jgi:excisionase family DNA binding protein